MIPADIRCPLCDQQGPPLAGVGDLMVCGSCGASLVNDGSMEEILFRRATAADTLVLTASELHVLRVARGSVVRAKS